MTTDEKFMREALALAGQGAREGEVPVGAVVVIDGAIAGSGSNSPVGHSDPTAHAEILAIRQAAARAGNYRLTGATLYCTLEPCARDLRFGGVRSKFQVADSPVLNHRVEVVEGVLAVECVERLRAFFASLR